MMEPEPLFPRDQYIKILHDLFSTAYGTNGFDTICSVLRVGGMADANWDAFAESRIAFDDYNWILDQVSSEKGATAARRFSLLMYCQAVEMSGAQEIIANLLRCTLKRAFVIDPFFDPWKRRKKNPLFRPPPSATTKYNRIRALATECKRDDLVGALDAFFDERIRNAFSTRTTSSPMRTSDSPIRGLLNRSRSRSWTTPFSTASRYSGRSSISTTNGWATLGRSRSTTACQTTRCWSCSPTRSNHCTVSGCTSPTVLQRRTRGAHLVSKPPISSSRKTAR